MKIINYDREIVNPNLFIPELVLLEIFRYLPLESVHRFMCVSKVWFSLLTKTLETLYATHYAFYDGHLAVASTDLLSSNFAYDGFSFKSIHSKLRKLSEKLCLAGSSNGLVLFIVTPRYSHCNYNYYVYNPLTKRISGEIPTPSGQYWWDDTNFLHGFICQSKSSSTTSSSTSTSSSSTFTVVRIKDFDNTSEDNNDPPTKFEIQVFSSELGEWCVYEVSSPPEVSWETSWNGRERGFFNYGNLSGDDNLCSENITITDKRVLYWFEGDRQNRIIGYDMTNNGKEDVRDRQCILIALPEGRDEEDFKYQCLGKSGEFICYTQLQRKAKTLCIWVSNQSSHSPEWEMVYKIELKNMLACDKDRWFNEDYLYLDTEIFPLAFHPGGRHVVLLAYSNAYILALNVRTKRFDVLKRPPTEILDAYPWLRSDIPLVLTPRPTTIPLLPQQQLFTKRKTKSRS